MQFVKDGPNIPIELFRAQEDGQLVLFCGAGISVPAGLPLFKGLVESVARILGESFDNPLLDAEMTKGNYDRVLGLLESKYIKAGVREATIKSLELSSTADLAMHKDIATLGRTRSGNFRIVTTNFDHGFSRVTGERASIDAAPKLPIPKDHKWKKSIVHLHGMIDTVCDPEGANLVLTSADFGAAYLTEGWAARFVTELFRNYTVLFIGYGVDDPVMRYLVDALAADRSEGSQVQQAYAVAPFSPSKRRWRSDVEREWEAKNVTPILFNERNRFKLLSETLSKWAGTYKAGLSGRVNIISRAAQITPKPPYDSDERVQQVLWALRERDGNIASKFADLDPPPPVEWLDVFLESGLLALPPPAPDIPKPVPVVSEEYRSYSPPKLDPVTWQLCRWLVNYRDEPKVIDWILNTGSYLHPAAKHLFDRALGRSDLPEALLRFWQIITSDTYCTPYFSRSPGALMHQWAQAGNKLQLFRQEFLLLLTPYLQLEQAETFALPVERRNDKERFRDAQNIDEIADPKVRLYAGAESDLVISEAKKLPGFDALLPDLADELTTLLIRVFDLFALCDQADERSDLSYMYHPSIADHEQNHDYEEWSKLIELLRQAFDALTPKEPAKAKTLVQRWRNLRYPIFERFVMYAMTATGLYTIKQILDFLLADTDGLRLWGWCTGRESRLLKNHLWPRMSEAERETFLKSIIDGPPRDMYRADLSKGEWQRRWDRDVWSELKSLSELGGPKLPDYAGSVLAKISAKQPAWQLSELEKTGFAAIYSSGQGGRESHFTAKELLEMTDEELLNMLRDCVKEKLDRTIEEWAKACTQKPARGIQFLSHLTDRSAWDAQIWSSSLRGLRETEQPNGIWQELQFVILKVPVKFLGKFSGPAVYLLQTYSKNLPCDADSSFFSVWDHVYDAVSDDPENGQADHALIAAINSQTGILAQAALDRLWKHEPQRRVGLDTISPDVKARLTILSKSLPPGSVHARVVLASALQPLFAIDPKWTKEHLLPYFAWGHAEASRVWQGYLFNPRINPDLLAEIKAPFVEAVQHTDSLDRAARGLHQLIAGICFHNDDNFRREEQRDLLAHLTPDGLAEVARTLRPLVNNIERPEVVWEKQMLPVLQIWPKARDKRSPKCSFELAELLVSAGGPFQQALNEIRHTLLPIEHADIFMRRLEPSNLPDEAPGATLDFLSRILDLSRDYYFFDNWRKVLDRIAQADPSLENHEKYIRLNEYLQHRNW